MNILFTVPPRPSADVNLMETSTDSLEGNGVTNYNLMCKSSDSLELKTTLEHPSISTDSLKDPTLEQQQQFRNSRRISSDSLEYPGQDHSKDGSNKDSISEG